MSTGRAQGPIPGIPGPKIRLTADVGELETDYRRL